MVMASHWPRLFRHLLTRDAAVRRAFPQEALDRVEQAIRAAESRHSGEIRFAIEGSLHPDAIRRGLAPRARAVEMFAQLGVWDTAQNNGVLIYVLLADRAVEIVADRGVAHGRVAQPEWDAVCRKMEAAFREGRFADGAVAGIEAVADILAAHPPAPRSGNELPDAPVIVPRRS
jgi:uncharacterized membrane protein